MALNFADFIVEEFPGAHLLVKDVNEFVYSLLVILTILIIELCFITVLTQAYEYVTIYTIMWWQNGKSLG